MTGSIHPPTGLCSDVFGQILKYLGPQDLVSVACLGPAFGLDPNAEVYKTDVMKWARDMKSNSDIGKLMTTLPIVRKMDTLDDFHEPLLFEFKTACIFAAASFDLGMLMFLNCHGFPWSPAVTASAAYQGSIMTLMWSHRNGCVCDDWTLDCAVAGGDVASVIYLEKFTGASWDNVTSQNVAKYGSLDIMKFGYTRRRPWNEHATAAAAENGNIECLKFAHEHGCEWDQKTTGVAALFGNIDCLRYALANGCTYLESLSSCAMVSGLECLKCVREHGCPWSEETCVRAVEFDQFECLKYAIANGCDWDPDVCGEVAEAHGYHSYHEISRWIWDRGGSGGSIGFRVRERKRRRQSNF